MSFLSWWGSKKKSDTGPGGSPDPLTEGISCLQAFREVEQRSLEKIPQSPGQYYCLWPTYLDAKFPAWRQTVGEQNPQQWLQWVMQQCGDEVPPAFGYAVRFISAQPAPSPQMVMSPDPLPDPARYILLAFPYCLSSSSIAKGSGSSDAGGGSQDWCIKLGLFDVRYYHPFEDTPFAPITDLLSSYPLMRNFVEAESLAANQCYKAEAGTLLLLRPGLRLDGYCPDPATNRLLMAIPKKRSWSSKRAISKEKEPPVAAAPPPAGRPSAWNGFVFPEAKNHINVISVREHLRSSVKSSSLSSRINSFRIFSIEPDFLCLREPLPSLVPESSTDES